MVVDNPYTGRTYYPTIDGDEPLDLLDLPSMIVGAPQVAYNKGDYMSYGGGRESALHVAPPLRWKQKLCATCP